jgi:hypothetical protein
MAEIFKDFRWIHIAFGSVALLAFWIPAIAPKGGRLHVRVGWVYVACMSAVVLTAFVMSGMALTVPLSIRSFSQPLSADEIERFVRRSRELGMFLAYLGGVTLAAGWQGIRVLRTRRDPKSLRGPFTLALNIALVAAAIGVLVLGITERTWAFIGMSSVGMIVGGGNLSYLLKGPQSKMGWWYEHLASMIATGIAGYTAFLVFGGSRIFPALARTQFFALVWILPTLIGVPTIFATVAYYKRKFHEDGRPSDAGKVSVSATV